MADLTFSYNAKYIFSVDRQVRLEEMKWPVPIAIPFPQPTHTTFSIDDAHPTALEALDHCSIHEQHIYRVYQEERQGIIYLGMKPLDSPDSEFNRRQLGIIPDAYLDRQQNKLFMVWPRSKLEEVMQIVIPGERNGMPILIHTGILSACLVEEYILTHLD